MKRLLTCLVAAALVPLACQASAQSEEAEIMVTSEGSATVIDGDLARAEDEAISAAKRTAVELGVGVLVRSETLGRDFSEVRQTILTRSEGFISSWHKVEGSRRVESIEGDRLLSIKITARVKTLSLVNALSDIESICESMQRPRIMVLISESNMGKASNDPPASALAIARGLQEMNFDVVDPRTMSRLIEKQSMRGAVERDDARAASLLALQEGAEVLVFGTAASSEQAPPEGAERLKLASALLSVRIIYSDTGEALFTSRQTGGRGVSTSSLEEAGTRALDAAGAKLIKSDSARFAAQVIARWARESWNGRTLKLVADGITFSEMNALKKAVAEFRGHLDFASGSTFAAGTGTLYVRSSLTPDQFRQRLEDSVVGGKRVEIEQVQGAGTVVTLRRASSAK